MRIRGLLVAVVLAAVLGGLYLWSNKKQKEKASRPPADTTPKLLAIPEDQVRQLEIKKKGGEATIVRRRDDGKWEIVAPKPLLADQEAVGSITSALVSLSSDSVVEEKPANLARWGLTDPALSVTITRQDGKTERLLIGHEVPGQSSSFAKTDSDPRLFTIANWNKTPLDKTWKDLRDRRLLTFDSDRLTRVELNAKKQSLEFGKNNKNEWTILKPRPLRADGGNIEDLVRRLRDAKMDSAVSDEDAKKAASAFAGGAQVAVAKVTDHTGSQTLEVRKDKDKNYYAKSSAVEGVHKIGSDLGDGLDKGLDDFRNKKVFDFGFNEPSKIEIREGGKTAAFQKSGDKWVSGSKQMDPADIDSLIGKLRYLAASKFVEQAAGTPALEIAVTAADGKTVEKVSITKRDKDCFAKREADATVYQFGSTEVDEIKKAAAEVKEARK